MGRWPTTADALEPGWDYFVYRAARTRASRAVAGEALDMGRLWARDHTGRALAVTVSLYRWGR